MALNDLFSFFFPSQTPATPSKRAPRRPAVKDFTDGLVCNIELTRGLYHNTYPGMKLAGGLAYAPIAVPIWFMGLPIPVTENEKSQEILNKIVVDFSMDFKLIHTESHRDGTCWIWPHYSSKLREMIWEFIPDDSITDIIKDLNTGKIIKIITDEEMQITTGYNQTAYIRRKRTFEENIITVEWMSGKNLVPPEMLDAVSVNPSGVLPIPFANNAEKITVRGSSDYERLITDLKDYHDIELKLSQILAKFNPKLVQGVQSVDDWLNANSIDDVSTLDIEVMDLIFYKKDTEEPPTYIFPDRALEPYEAALKRKFKKMVEESLIPEIAWGVKVEGNLASAEKQIEGLIKYVEDKRHQHNNSYKLLFEASLRLLNITRMQNGNDQIEIEWNKLDAISEETKSNIFKNFSQGVAALVGSAGFTKEQLYNLWKATYPQTTEDDYEDFKKGLSIMGAHNQWRNASYIEVVDMQAGENDDLSDNQNTE